MTNEEKSFYENFAILDSAVYNALEPAGFFYENLDGSFEVDLSEFVPDLATYVEMCEQGENEHLLKNGTSLYHDLENLKWIFERFLFDVRVSRLSVDESNALYLRTGYRAVNKEVAEDIQHRKKKYRNVSDTDVQALDKYIANENRN